MRNKMDAEGFEPGQKKHKKNKEREHILEHNMEGKKTNKYAKIKIPIRNRNGKKKTAMVLSKKKTFSQLKIGHQKKLRLLQNYYMILGQEITLPTERNFCLNTIEQIGKQFNYKILSQSKAGRTHQIIFIPGKYTKNTQEFEKSCKLNEMPVF